MAGAATQTALRIKGHYTSTNTTNDTYTVELYDGGVAVDYLDFPVQGGVVETLAGYPKTCGGARQQAKDTWF